MTQWLVEEAAATCLELHEAAVQAEAHTQADREAAVRAAQDAVRRDLEQGA